MGQKAAGRRGPRDQRQRSRYSDEHLHPLYDAMACGVIVRDAGGRIVYTNATARRILGTGELEAGQHQSMPTGPRMREDGTALPAAETPGMVAFRTRRPVRDFVMRVATPTGEQRWLLVDAVPVFDDGGMPEQIITSFIDITERKLAEIDLQRQVLYDQLTGLPNRRLLMDRLTQALLVRKREGRSVGILFLDLDRFKLVNDALGHAQGDRVLQEAAHRLRTTLRNIDTLARFGGDEFVVLLPVASDVDAARTVAEKLIASLAEPIAAAGRTVTVGASVGIAVAPQHGDDPETLLRRADIAMYAAKRGQRGWATFTPELDRAMPGLGDAVATVALPKQGA